MATSGNESLNPHTRSVKERFEKHTMSSLNVTPKRVIVVADRSLLAGDKGSG